MSGARSASRRSTSGRRRRTELMFQVAMESVMDKTGRKDCPLLPAGRSKGNRRLWRSAVGGRPALVVLGVIDLEEAFVQRDVFLDVEDHHRGVLALRIGDGPLPQIVALRVEHHGNAGVAEYLLV